MVGAITSLYLCSNNKIQIINIAVFIKLKIQIPILIIGLISTALGIWTMVQTPTVILPVWFLVLLLLPIIFLISLGLGFVVKRVFKSSWHTLTFTSLIMTIACLTYYVSEYRSSYKIIIPENYVGQVKLFVSRDDKNDFNVNFFGIGYISNETYKEGFIPIVIKGDEDITKQIDGYGTGGYATSKDDKYSFNYLVFEVPGAGENRSVESVEDLVNQKAIDTTRLEIKKYQ